MAILVGKLIIIASRMAGNQGSNLPGKVASWIYPPLLQVLGGNVTHDTIVVTGTNGKTTTTNMLAAVIKAHGFSLVHNQAGANMLTGITTAFIRQTNWTGTRLFDYALLETDEANIPLLLQVIRLRYLLITNFFRDQLDRFGELDHTINLIKSALKKTSIELVLNGDDPLQSGFRTETGLRCRYYGFTETQYDTLEGSFSREGRYCIMCGEELQYERFHYAQLGAYKCSRCGNQNPKPDFVADHLNLTPKIGFDVNGLVIESPYQGFYNAYNVLAAVSVAILAGMNPEIIQKALAQFHPQAGRMETFIVNGKKAVLILIKNPTGFNQSLSMLNMDSSPKNIFMALNDNAADGRDISWIWDADVEILTAGLDSIAAVVCSGQRSGDMAIRMKYAGIPIDKITIQTSLEKGIEEAVNAPDPEISYILCTYTALFACRKILVKRQDRLDGLETVKTKIPGPSV